ncbi:MAG: glucose-1-phosphate adenylyltransferase [bacterium]|nr:glucose-1-phosphate adenylyltransferase [bacterium]
MEQTSTLILAGGRGERLYPLTKHRAKPAVPFGGIYRVIDFTLSNCLNSGLQKVHLLTQYASLTLDRHIRQAWSTSGLAGSLYIELVPPQAQLVDRWYAGTADAIFQNLFLLQEERPERVLILSGDHIYKMDYRLFLDAHERNGADVTVGVLPVPIEQASRFGVLTLDSSHRIVSFAEKPAVPRSMPEDSSRAWVSMGIYCFRTSELVKALIADSKNPSSTRDFGHDILPALIKQGNRVYAYPFRDENKKAELYWRDIGSLDQFYSSNMDLVAVDPLFNLYDKEWPIRTNPRFDLPPAKTVFDDDQRRGFSVDSLQSPGVIISGATVRKSVLFTGCHIHSWATVEESVLLANVDVGRHAKIRRAIVEEGVHILPNDTIGYDPASDRQRFTITDEGIVVVTATDPERREIAGT